VLVSVNCHTPPTEFVNMGVQSACTVRSVVAQSRDETLAGVWQFNVTFPPADTVRMEICGGPGTVSDATALVALPQALLTRTE
jgi:hypothetical protein